MNEGRTCTETAKLIGVARGTVSRWVSSFRQGSEVALRMKKRGRRLSEMTLLKPYQCAIIVNLITDRCPDQLKMPFMVWTRETVGMLIERKFGVKMAVRSNYLKRWGFTPQKPLRRAYERQDRAVKLISLN